MASKIYLLSGGDRLKGFVIPEIKKELIKDLKGKKNLVAIGAKRDYERNDIYFNGNETTLGTTKTFLFSDLEKFSLLDGRINKEDGLKLLEEADVIYLQGGDPYIQLDYIKKNGYDVFLKNYNGIILGLSAGSMNLGKVSFYSKDEEYTKTTFYEGLGIVDLTISPHFDINNKEEVEELVKGSYKHRIIGLPDNSCIIVNNDGVAKSININYVYENGKLIN